MEGAPAMGAPSVLELCFNLILPIQKEQNWWRECDYFSKLIFIL